MPEDRHDSDSVDAGRSTSFAACCLPYARFAIFIRPVKFQEFDPFGFVRGKGRDFVNAGRLG